MQVYFLFAFFTLIGFCLGDLSYNYEKHGARCYLNLNNDDVQTCLIGSYKNVIASYLKVSSNKLYLKVTNSHYINIHVWESHNVFLAAISDDNVRFVTKNGNRIYACNIDIDELDLTNQISYDLIPHCQYLNDFENIKLMYFYNGGLYYDDYLFLGIYLSKSLYTFPGTDIWNNGKGIVMGALCMFAQHKEACVNEVINYMNSSNDQIVFVNPQNLF